MTDQPTPEPTVTETPTPTESQTSSTSTSTPSTTPEPTTLLNTAEPEAPPPAPVIPEAYDLKFGEGTELDSAALAEITPVLKELGITQEGAQKLADFYAKSQKGTVDRLIAEQMKTRQEWRTQAEAYLGTNATQAKADIGSALNSIFAGADGVPDSTKIGQFRQFMDMTGAGDNPAFVEAFHKLAKNYIEGKAVTGNGPAPVKPPGASRPTLAQALYPNLNQPQSG